MGKKEKKRTKILEGNKSKVVASDKVDFSYLIFLRVELIYKISVFFPFLRPKKNVAILHVIFFPVKPLILP